jgi:hypothetical protein
MKSSQGEKRMTKLALMVLALLTSAASAQETLRITQGFAMPLPELPTDITNIVVGDPDIVDVRPDHNNYLLFGKKAGSSNVLAFDEKGNLVLDATVTVSLPPVAVPQRGPGDVRIFNLPKFGSQEYYCTPRSCEKTTETHYQLPTQILKYEGGVLPPPPVGEVK